jgi:hypothetical protein
MSPLKLTDDQIDQIFRAAAPLAPHDRDAFLRDVAERLSKTVVGEGSVYKACVEAQRSFLDYPQFGSGHWAKHR